MQYPATIPVDGVVGAMDALINYLMSTPAQFRVRLYANLYTPAQNSVLASFTEPTFAGYAPLYPGTPTQSPPTPGGRAIWTWPQSVWTASGAGLPAMCFGFFTTMVDPLTSTVRVLWAQRFQSAQAVYASGQTIQFTLSLGNREC
jgi:hypothetical protein